MIDFKTFRKEYNVKQEELCIELNVKQSFISQVENDKVAIPQYIKDYILEKYGVVVYNNYGKNETQDNISYMTYLLPMSAMGGNLTGYSHSAEFKDCEKIVSPIGDVDFAITIYGDSMSPEYDSGSRVLIKRINPDVFIEWGKVFVLDTANGVIIKQVEHSERDGYITCKSFNPKYAPFDVSLNDIYGMYRVLMCMTMK